MEKLKAPFPYFGGKKDVAAIVWSRLGDCDNYIEPFAGSCAVLLLRPDPPKVETLNDLDCYVANFWRAAQQAPDAVAQWADGPVNEADLHARHRWLVLSDDAAAWRLRMRQDPHYFDAKIAGWWCWGLCCWIGSGWCDASQLERHQNRPPHHSGMGVVAKGGPSDTNRPQLADAFARGRGVHGCDAADRYLMEGKRPALTDARSLGHGVHAGTVGTCASRRAWLLDWFGRLRDRLRTVRVCCGDWLRVCDSPSVTTRLGTTGIFFDPPYSAEAKRNNKLYAQESKTVAHDVRAYCLERGADPQMRICLAGYSGEGHEVLEAAGWSVVEWKAQGGYGNRSDVGKANAKKERLWFSPHCQASGGLFDGLGDA